MLDELDGWSLVAGSGTVALVGPDGHVRAAHRFAFGSMGADGRFVDFGGPVGSADHAYAVVGNADVDGFRSRWADQLVRWDLDTDTTEHLASLGYATPSFARLGSRVIAGNEPGGPLLVISADDVAELSDLPPLVAQPYGARDWCAAITEDGNAVALLRLDDVGALVVDHVPDEVIVELLSPTDLAVVHPPDEAEAPRLVRLPLRTPVDVEGLRVGEHPIEVVRRGSSLWVRFESDEGFRDLAIPAMTWEAAIEHVWTYEPWGAPDASLPDLGPYGVVAIEHAPRSTRLALATGARTLVFGEEGLVAELDGGGWLSWAPSELALRVADEVRPFEGPSRDADSMFVPGPIDFEAASPEEDALERWLEAIAAAETTAYEAEEAANAEGVAYTPSDPTPPPLVIEPVCAPPGPRRRCVRLHVDGLEHGGWDVFDPSRPGRTLATIETDFVRPPSARSTFVAPGGRYLRETTDDQTRIVSLGRGTSYELIQIYVELDAGWVWVDPDDWSSLHALSYTRGELRTRSLGAEIRQLTILDGSTVAVLVGDEVHVVGFRDLATSRTFSLASEEPEHHWNCSPEGLVDSGSEDETPRPFPCPSAEEHDYFQTGVTVSADHRFWADNPLGDVVRVRRVADGAELSIRISARGWIAWVGGAFFEGSGDLVEHVVVREPGPVRTAEITVGADARARFERPGLVGAFFRGEPLPAP